MPPATWTIRHTRIEEQIVPGKRLGRHIRVDSRDARYPYLRRIGVPLAAVKHDRRVPIFDQGNVGSCTGNAETGVLGTDPFFSSLPSGISLTEAEALRLYSAAESLDGDGPYPPQDNGSSGPSVCQAAKNAGLISGYTHAATVDDMASALQSVPVIVGVNWYTSFDDPDSSGVITISPGATVRGGHEFEVYGVDPVAQMFYADQSWGLSYGIDGTFSFSWDTMAQLLAEQGDCTVSVPRSQPAPVPTPPPPGDDPDTALWDIAGPWCAQTRTRPDLVVLKGALDTWAAAKQP